jgi:hypothetical protein
MGIIRRHLHARALPQPADRILRVDNQLVSVDFREGPQPADQVLESAGAGTTRAKRRNRKPRKYKEDWDHMPSRKQAGGEILTISSFRLDVVAALVACTKLGPGRTPTRQAMYAE